MANNFVAIPAEHGDGEETGDAFLYRLLGCGTTQINRYYGDFHVRFANRFLEAEA
ncbi:MAG: hypothetical protein OXI87_21290 [Albidovulum sp.]|nr:hypothetical protein [Albidovulum sp.]MDE0307389.1 hypothetical protein [Albidovulum sp.]MDE0531133.1 hypothetical protein [Albidovulum sp.]